MSEKKEYRGLNPADKKFHDLGPKDIKHGEEKDLLCSIQIQVPTGGDGEMMGIQVPVYKTDSSEDMRDRVRMLMSVPQERKEDFGEAVERLTKASHENKLATKAAMDAENLKRAEEKRLAKMVKKGQLRVVSEEPAET
jgi:hypothetical protein